MASPAEFIRQVKQEGKKVTWPTRKETIMASIIIMVVTAIFSVFFFCVDYLVSSGIKLLLGLNF